LSWIQAITAEYDHDLVLDATLMRSCFKNADYVQVQGTGRRKSGQGVTVGLGCDFLLDPKIAYTLFVTCTFGDADDIDCTAITFGIGILRQ
jgi:hypothetical protein